jgi:hypothetical protein
MLGWPIFSLVDFLIFKRDERFFSSPELPGWLWGPHNPLFIGYRGSFPMVKRPRRQVNHSPPSIAEVKHEWSYTFTSPLSLCGVDVEIFTH